MLTQWAAGVKMCVPLQLAALSPTLPVLVLMTCVKNSSSSSSPSAGAAPDHNGNIGNADAGTHSDANDANDGNNDNVSFDSEYGMPAAVLEALSSGGAPHTLELRPPSASACATFWAEVLTQCQAAYARTATARARAARPAQCRRLPPPLALAPPQALAMGADGAAQRGAEGHDASASSEPPPRPRTASQREKDEHCCRELRTFLRAVLVEIKKDRCNGVFWRPVDPEEVVDYYEIISEPMDLETIRLRIDAGEYLSLRPFLRDINLIVRNADEYNPRSVLAKDARGRAIVHAAHNLRDLVLSMVRHGGPWRVMAGHGVSWCVMG